MSAAYYSSSALFVIHDVLASLVPRHYPSFFNVREKKLVCVQKAGIRPGYEVSAGCLVLYRVYVKLACVEKAGIRPGYEASAGCLVLYRVWTHPNNHSLRCHLYSSTLYCSKLGTSGVQTVTTVTGLVAGRMCYIDQNQLRCCGALFG